MLHDEPTPGVHFIFCNRRKFNKYPVQKVPLVVGDCDFCGHGESKVKCRGCGALHCHRCSTYDGPNGDQCPNCENKRRTG